MPSRTTREPIEFPKPERPAERTEEQELAEVGRAFVAIWCQAQEHVAGHLPPSQLRALQVVADKPGISVRELARELDAMPSSVSRLCERLVVASLLERAPADIDRRQVTLRPTAEGTQVLNDITLQRRADLKTILARMSAEQRSQLLQGLAAFAAHTGTR
ncbi:MarR family winged helix-turn-helix transcriptional regulator [Actinomadura decatromicini]|uniref:MarR family winged helix-turn-helix transcriptional regulator n=1 Tax=Actinomadura decatromicini TaxID=2604572 RepID=UPI0016533FD8|nr:MarR family winged helix-turn-helix transcriptional regulator [Actinomadura decatromicini]